MVNLTNGTPSEAIEMSEKLNTEHVVAAYSVSPGPMSAVTLHFDQVRPRSRHGLTVVIGRRDHDHGPACGLGG